MPPKVSPKPKAKVPVKGKPGGIPTWGWIVGAVLGILIGYVLLKNSGGISSPSSGGSVGATTSPADATPSDNKDAPIPWDQILAAMGLRGGGTGTFPGSSVSESSSQTAAADAAQSPSVSDPQISGDTTGGDVARSIAASLPTAPGVDAQQAFASAALGVLPSPNQTLEQINEQLTSQGLAPASYPSTITSKQPGTIDSSMGSTAPVIGSTSTGGMSMIAAHAAYGRDPV